ncbi:MAG: alpha/beta fold hydrolase [Acidimicrobiia bacterium]
MRLTAALLALALAGTAACADDEAAPTGDGDPTSTTTTTEAPPVLPVELGPDEDLYALAASWSTPGEPGDPIAVQEVEIPGLEDATVRRVLYHSESVQGDDVVVSGLIAYPDGPVPPEGRAVLSWAHGTTGLADACAPSVTLPAGELGLAAPFLERGMVVTATDYEGMGTPGRHPYMVGESEGRGVLDVVRAARRLGDEVGASERVVVWGHSQGGHAALFANQVAADWAPELDLVGTVAGAPPSQLPLIADALRDSPFRFYLALVAAGWGEAYPDADPADLLTAEGMARLDVVDRECGRALADDFSDLAYEELIAAHPGDVEPWAGLLDANDPGHEPGSSPVLIVHGEADEQIPVVSSQLLLERMCTTGQVVERRTYPGQDHAGVIGPSMADVLAWIDARLAGDAPATSC